MRHVETIIKAKWVIPVDDQNSILNDHAIAIDQGKILAIMPSIQIGAHFTATHTHHLDNHAVLPGFINAHTHVAMNLMRGFADDLPLMTWLMDYILPAEKRLVSEQMVYDGSLHAMAELIKSGVTCFNDMYYFAMATAKAAKQAGLRGFVADTIINIPRPWAPTVADAFELVLQSMDAIKDYPLLSISIAPHAPYTSDDGILTQVRNLARDYQKQIHMHVHETLTEVEQFHQQYQMRPLARLQQLGLCGPQFIAVHMTELTPQEIKILADTGTHVVHCPESNMKLASGVCPISQLLLEGVNVALGTDGVASNNDLDMIGEMRTAALLAKISSKNPEALPATQVLRMATINGAKALGISKITGSLEVGKAADIIAIDLHHIATTPIYNPIAQIVYAASKEQVTDSWVAGKQLMKGRKLLTLNESAIIAIADEWQLQFAKTTKSHPI